MGTIVFYMDESGSTDSYSIPIQNGKTPLFTLTSVALRLVQWRDIDRQFNSLKERFFPDILQRRGRKEEIEVKGNDIAAPRNKDSVRRHQFLNEVFMLLRRFDARLFCVSFIKSASNPMSSRSMYTHGFQILLERFNHYVANNARRDSGIIICDSRAGAIKGNGLDKEVAKSLQSFLFGNDLGKTFTCMHEAPLFADSQITVGIQITDIMSSCIYSNHYQYYVRELQGAVDYSHMKKYWPQVDELEYKYVSVDQTEKVFGFRILNHLKNDQ